MSFQHVNNKNSIFFLVLSLRNQVCILHFQSALVGANHISRALEPWVARGSHAGQTGFRQPTPGLLTQDRAVQGEQSLTFTIFLVVCECS